MESDEVRKIHEEGRYLTIKECRRAIEEQHNINWDTGKKKD